MKSTLREIDFRSRLASRFAAVVYVGVAVGVNPWSLEATIVPDGHIESAAVFAGILLAQAMLFAVGVWVLLQRSDWLIRPAIALASLILTIAGFEAIFRLVGVEAHYPEPRRDQVMRAPGGPTERRPHGFIPRVTVRSTYASNPRGYFEAGNTIDHIHNSMGWRDVEHSVQKPLGVFRILGLGDSYLFGQGVRREDIALTKIGIRLQEGLDIGRVETINTGTSGTNTSDQLATLREAGLSYDPDLVILFYVPNDVEIDLYDNRQKVEFFRDYTSIYQRPDRLSEFSKLWGWARQRFQQLYTARKHVRDSVAAFSAESPGWRQSREALQQIQQLLRERGSSLLVVIFPFFHNLNGHYPFQKVHDIVSDYCESIGIPVLDLRDSYRDYEGPELWVHATDQHPNEEANEIAAEAVGAYLRAHPELLR